MVDYAHKGYNAALCRVDKLGSDKPMKTAHWRGFILVGVLLLIAASRLIQVRGLDAHPDEIWSVWQSLGSLQDILRWTPYDWPPGYYLTLGLWQKLVGSDILLLRWLSIMAFMLGAVFFYRALLKIRNYQAALIGTLIYATLGYNILLSVELRGYALLVMLAPLALWQTAVYFTRRKLINAIILGLSIAAMFYVSYTSVGLFVILGIYTLVVYGREVWRWVLPGGLALVLMLPQVLAIQRLAINRIDATVTLELPPLTEALPMLFADYVGENGWLWVVLALIALGLILWWERLPRQHSAGVLLWALGMPVLFYFLNPVLGFFSPRYAWWIMLGIALTLAWGLAYLPRWGAAIVSVGLAILLFYPAPFEHYSVWKPNITTLYGDLRLLRSHMHTGDVFLQSPEAACARPEEWDFYLRYYFPAGFTFIDEPGDQRRIWYAGFSGRDVPEQSALVRENRVETFVFGPPQCRVRLYEAPPNIQGIAIGNGLRFHGADVIDNGQVWTGPLVRHEGESVELRLWWSVDAPLTEDYQTVLRLQQVRSDGAILQDENTGPVQLSHPEGAAPQTHTWEPGQYYLETRTVSLIYPSRIGDYTITLSVLDQGGVLLPWPEGQTDFPLKSLFVMAY
jgi:hypothetical protein